MELMITDKEYEDLLRAKRKAKRVLKKNNYRLTKPECCTTCINSLQDSIEDERLCYLINIGLCDEYQSRAVGLGRL
jgi:hypothetical protein